MQWLQSRFTVRGLVLTVAVVAIGLAILSFFRWLRYPHINVTIFNEASTPVFDLRVIFACGDRTAERLVPGDAAVAEIQSREEAGVFFSYRDSEGALKKTQAPYMYMENRGSLEFHVTNESVRVVNSTYWFDEIPILGIRRVPPKGRMTIIKP